MLNKSIQCPALRLPGVHVAASPCNSPYFRKERAAHKGKPKIPFLFSPPPYSPPGGACVRQRTLDSLALHVLSPLGLVLIALNNSINSFFIYSFTWIPLIPLIPFFSTLLLIYSLGLSN